MKNSEPDNLPHPGKLGASSLNGMMGVLGHRLNVDPAATMRYTESNLAAFVDGLRGLHAFEPRGDGKAGTAYNERVKKRALKSDHPLVTVHAETGERVLFVSPSFLKSVIGLTPRESHKILEILWEHVIRPEYTVRFKWNAGDIAFWDNRSTAHLAPRDIFQSDFDRQLYRITLVGEPLVGVDGQPSRSIEGLPILSATEELRMMAAE